MKFFECTEKTNRFATDFKFTTTSVHKVSDGSLITVNVQRSATWKKADITGDNQNDTGRGQWKGTASEYMLTWTFYSLVVVWIDADLLLFLSKSILAHIKCLQLMVTLQIGPAPNSAINNMGEPFPMRHLQPAIQRPRYRHTLADLPRPWESFFQVLHGPLLLLQSAPYGATGEHSTSLCQRYIVSCTAN